MPRITSRKRAKIPKTQSKGKEQRLAEAYERLGVTREEVAKQPIITTVLKEGVGGVDKGIEYLRTSSEPDATKFLRVYDELPNSHRVILPIEAFALAANITTKRVLELITGACFEQSSSVAELISKSAKPKLVQVSVKAGMKLKNFEDRKMVLQHEGYAPLPKTQVVNVSGGVNTDNRIQSVSINELGGVEKAMSRVNDRFNDLLAAKGITSLPEPQPQPEQRLIEGKVEGEVEGGAEAGLESNQELPDAGYQGE